MAVQLSNEDNKHYVINFLKAHIIIAATKLLHVMLVVFYMCFNTSTAVAQKKNHILLQVLNHCHLISRWIPVPK
jgi:hypothetical protein